MRRFVVDSRCKYFTIHSSARLSGEFRRSSGGCSCEKHYWVRGAAQYAVVHHATNKTHCHVFKNPYFDFNGKYLQFKV